ncbi:NAD(P)H-quinone oxidoreductase [Aureimonas psammosilenae]|uniref:NAD(P)H-quinone oxidoreductase n=1 Tax=Aureimonas psammosilenae TaxID=2495496 RepID=UPI0012610A82|nr:NAD(P)H-quinone oxidoreductase [Aureimonas psammosilenae]
MRRATVELAREMTAIVLNGFGGPEVLTPRQMPVPVPKSGEILIEVAAAGVNRPDVLQRLGAYPPPQGAPDWPGLEVSGRVVARGEGAERFAVGDLVMALLPGGGYADYATVAEGSVMPVPEGLDLASAAAFPETFFTVWHNVFQRGALKESETLLVHGGTSGIGTTAIQLAKAFGARVAVTVGSADKVEAARRLGVDHIYNYRTEDFVEGLREATSGHGADVILDMVGGDYVSRNLAVAAESGRIVQIAFLRGKTAEIDLSLIMQKRLTLTGSTLRAQSLAYKAAIAREIEEKVLPFAVSGQARPIIEASYPLTEAAEAHRHLDEDHVGKIVLKTKFFPME